MQDIKFARLRGGTWWVSARNVCLAASKPALGRMADLLLADPHLNSVLSFSNILCSKHNDELSTLPSQKMYIPGLWNYYVNDFPRWNCLILPQPVSVSGLVSKPAHKAASVRAFFLHLYWSAGESMSKEQLSCNSVARTASNQKGFIIWSCHVDAARLQNNMMICWLTS